MLTGFRVPPVCIVLLSAILAIGTPELRGPEGWENDQVLDRHVWGWFILFAFKEVKLNLLFIIDYKIS